MYHLSHISYLNLVRETPLHDQQYQDHDANSCKNAGYDHDHHGPASPCMSISCMYYKSYHAPGFYALCNTYTPISGQGSRISNYGMKVQFQFVYVKIYEHIILVFDQVFASVNAMIWPGHQLPCYITHSVCLSVKPNFKQIWWYWFNWSNTS